MKCPTCDVYTRILETRANPDGMRRRYQCANLHRFTTQETLCPPPRPMLTQAQLRQQLKDESYD